MNENEKVGATSTISAYQLIPGGGQPEAQEFVEASEYLSESDWYVEQSVHVDVDHLRAESREESHLRIGSEDASGLAASTLSRGLPSPANRPVDSRFDILGLLTQ